MVGCVGSVRSVLGCLDHPALCDWSSFYGVSGVLVSQAAYVIESGYCFCLGGFPLFLDHMCVYGDLEWLLVLCCVLFLA